LSDGMLFARCRKQGHRKENSEDALTNKGSHNALAQLSVSAATRKDESAVVAQASCLWGRWASSLPKVYGKGFRRDARTPHRQDACATCD
jgi:hypothetical protein